MMGDRTEHPKVYILNKYKPWMRFFLIYIFIIKKLKKGWGENNIIKYRGKMENTVHCLFVNMTNELFVARMRKKSRWDLESSNESSKSTKSNSDGALN